MFEITREQSQLSNQQKANLLAKIQGFLVDSLYDYENTSLHDEPVITPQGSTYSGHAKGIKSYIRQNPQHFPDPIDELYSPLTEVQLRKNKLAAQLVQYYCQHNVDVTKIPDCLKCPLTGNIFNDPYVALDGNTYERTAEQRQDDAYTNLLVKNVIEALYQAKLIYEKEIEILEPVLDLPENPFEEAKETVVEVTGASQDETGNSLLDDIRELLVDPLDAEYLKNPVIMPDGKTFRDIKTGTFNSHLKKTGTNPYTMEAATRNDLRVNFLVAEIISCLDDARVDEKSRIKNICALLVCPLTNKKFQNPVVADDGKTYERADLINHLQLNNNTLPGGNIVQCTDISGIQYTNEVISELIELIPAEMFIADTELSEELSDKEEILLDDETEHQTIPKSSPTGLELALTQYMIQRKQAANNQANHYHTFFGRIFGFSAGEKYSAAEEVLHLCQNPKKQANFTARQLEALSRDTLGDIMAQHKNDLPKAFLRAAVAHEEQVFASLSRLR